MAEYKMIVEAGEADEDLITAGMDTIDVSLARMLAQRAQARIKGETSHEKGTHTQKPMQSFVIKLTHNFLSLFPMNQIPKFSCRFRVVS